MSHLDDEQLALIALGEPATPLEAAHLETCDACTREVRALTRTVAVGRSTLGLGELEAPPDRVWERISAEVAEADGTAGAGSSTRPGAPRAAGERDDLAPATITAPAEPLRGLRRVGRTVFALAASAALVLALVGTWALLRPTPPSQIAAATLDSFPAHPRAEGAATVVENADGERVVHVVLDDDEPASGYREVWLITADASALVSLGILEGDEADFAIPAGIDIREYVLVDISLEPLDGDPTHSGDSIVRGELDFA